METLIEALAQFVGEMPMFPLPQMVFFPHTLLPLHIFEPRYREMIQDVRKGGLPIAMGNLTLRRSLDADGRLEVAEVAGAGFMTRCEELPDGRFLIELSGVARVKITSERPSGRLYRVVAVEILNDEPGDDDRTQERLDTLQVLVISLAQHNERVGQYLQHLLRTADSPAAAADAVANAIVTEPKLRQALMEELNVEKRLDTVLGRMAELLALAAHADDDTPLN